MMCSTVMITAMYVHVKISMHSLAEEAELRSAGVPIPANYAGGTKSYTVPPAGFTDRDGATSIGVMRLGAFRER